ncbi:hypothetical protein ACQ4OB_07895 [Pseudomonas sp. ES4]|uniref:hypothetical protein n=1 Tax=Pseudomonas sp. ES4 TaxID=3424777 RepID=UPI003D33174B
MASEGKQSPFTFKNIALSAAGIVLTSWAIPKALDYFLDTTLLTTIQGWLLRAWNWALLDTPMPNWSLVMIIVVLISTLCVAIYYYRTIEIAYSDLNEAEQTIDKLRNPDPTDLSRSQAMVLMNIANFAASGLPPSLSSLGLGLGSGTGFKPLELEVVIERLAEKGYVQFSRSAGVSSSSSLGTPCLTLKGKEYVLARRKRNSELEEQKSKAATPES